MLPERGVPRVQATSESDTAAHVLTVLALLVGAAKHVASVLPAGDYHIGQHIPDGSQSDGSQLVTSLERTQSDHVQLPRGSYRELVRVRVVPDFTLGGVLLPCLGILARVSLLRLARASCS